MIEYGTQTRDAEAERGFVKKGISQKQNFESRKNFEKSWKKVLTREDECDILSKLSWERQRNWTLKIKQREEKEPDKNLRKEVLFNSNSD